MAAHISLWVWNETHNLHAHSLSAWGLYYYAFNQMLHVCLFSFPQLYLRTGVYSVPWHQHGTLQKVGRDCSCEIKTEQCGYSRETLYNLLLIPYQPLFSNFLLTKCLMVNHLNVQRTFELGNADQRPEMRALYYLYWSTLQLTVVIVKLMDNFNSVHYDSLSDELKLSPFSYFFFSHKSIERF